jgi:dATP pyrophosphohydrolase
MGTKRPVSVLVVVHTPALECLLLERASHPGYWQSVTGSQEGDETLVATARREVFEETGISADLDRFSAWNLANRFEIFAEWRDRFPEGVTHNLEHVFSLEIPAVCPVRIAVGEHRAVRWLPWREAANAVFSWTNRDAILMLAERRGVTCKNMVATPLSGQR